MSLGYVAANCLSAPHQEKTTASGGDDFVRRTIKRLGRHEYKVI